MPASLDWAGKVLSSGAIATRSKSGHKIKDYLHSEAVKRAEPLVRSLLVRKAFLLLKIYPLWVRGRRYGLVGGKVLWGIPVPEMYIGAFVSMEMK